MTRAALNFITTASPLAPRPAQSRRSPVSPALRRPVLVASHTLNGQTIERPLQLAGQNILVKIAEATDKTEGGIFLSSDAQEKPTFGEAVGVGGGRFYGNGIKVPMHVAAGDTVMYGKYGGTDVNYDGDKHTIVSQDDVLCKFKDGNLLAASCEPIFDRVLVKLEKPSEDTVGGIIISKTAKEKSNSGEVVAVGCGRFMENGDMEPMDFAVGDTVMYQSYAGTNVTLDGDDYVVVRVSDIFAKI